MARTPSVRDAALESGPLHGQRARDEATAAGLQAGLAALLSS